MKRPQALAICTTAMGDTVLCTPALAALGEAFDLDVLVHQHRLPLLIHQPGIRRLYAYRNNPLFRAWLALTLALRVYDRVLVLHANDDMIKLLKLIRYRRAGNIQGWRRVELRLSHLAMDPGMHVVDKRLALARWAGAPQGDPHLRIRLLPEELTQADQWLRDQGLAPGRPRVGMCLGAAHLFKRWPAERFGRVARGLMDDGAQILLLGGANEEDLMRRAEEAAGGPLPRLVHVPMRELASVIASLDLLVTNDTGPLHLSQSVGTPILGLFGPTDPETIGPRTPEHGVIKVDKICPNCTTKQCTTPTCMEALPMEPVLAKARQMLADQASSREVRS